MDNGVYVNDSGHILELFPMNGEYGYVLHDEFFRLEDGGRYGSGKTMSEVAEAIYEEHGLPNKYITKVSMGDAIEMAHRRNRR